MAPVSRVPLNNNNDDDDDDDDVSLCQIPSVRLAHEGHFGVVLPNLVVHGPSGPSVRASPSEGIEVPLLQPAPLPGLSAGR
jgi:hypothetical protein